MPMNNSDLHEGDRQQAAAKQRLASSAPETS